ncbi:MAG: hypothetical protein DRP29_00155 [Thermodesulfobacteriota bacterium]|nr:MAG: hypothetical protein DRP29_00155 [Thermodesulfobacteriota bacterium]
MTSWFKNEKFQAFFKSLILHLITFIIFFSLCSLVSPFYKNEEYIEIDLTGWEIGSLSKGGGKKGEIKDKAQKKVKKKKVKPQIKISKSLPQSKKEPQIKKESQIIKEKPKISEKEVPKEYIAEKSPEKKLSENFEINSTTNSTLNSTKKLIGLLNLPSLSSGSDENRLEGTSGEGTGTGIGNGIGAGNGSGNSQGFGSGNGTSTQAKIFLKEKLSIIRNLIRQYLKYPYMARKMGWEGKVIVSFMLNPNGGIENLKIEKSSNYKVLDKEALKAVKRASKLFPIPPVNVKVKVPILFRLE